MIKYDDLVNPMDFNNTQQIKGVNIDPIQIKPVSLKYGIRRVTWTNKEVEKMNIIEDLWFLVVEFF